MSAIIAGYARTPFVKSNGQFATLAATVLGAKAAEGALARAGIAPEAVQAVIAGQVLQGGAGQNPARQSAVGAGVPLTTPATTTNVVCISGMDAIIQAARLIATGEADVVLAIGQESMTLAPHAWSGSRSGKKFGAIELIDTLEHDGLTDAFERRSMGLSTDHVNESLGLDRADQDEWAAQSHRRLATAIESGVFDDEIVPVEITGRAGTVSVTTDDGVRADTTAESLGKLRASFREGGSVTAGNASQISDGAAALVIVSEEWAAANSVTGIARILGHALVSGPDVSLHAQPAAAIETAAARAGRTVAELAAVEINEAFASVSVHSTARLGVDPAIVNPNGGAIALGHPIGASGARIVGHLALQLRRLGAGSIGAAGICGGGGQGGAVILEAL